MNIEERLIKLHRILMLEMQDVERSLDRLTKVCSEISIQSNNSFITANEAAKYLGCSAANIYKLTMNCEIPYYKPNGKKLYFKKNELDEWIEKSRVPSIYETLNEDNDERKRILQSCCADATGAEKLL